ncbi:hypothetical protein ACFO0N_18310 [Halobium salinum]|uniref:Uncharacterized protein n=1 Tax=Halobium salinum TaxID=1364940 RepID=A0ABD5PGB7_9EURY|nr:hypothetical protein [Halobium salinum]
MRESGVFHVVCRECRTESVVDRRADAETVAESHRSAVGHRVEFARVE